MKTIEELAGLAPSDVADITAKVISDTIEEIARGKRVFAACFKENRDLIGPGKPREISFPKKGTGISASWNVSPGATITGTTMTYSAVTISVKKGGVRLEFTNEAIEQALRDVIADHIKEAGLVWAETIDTIALETLLDVKLGTLTMNAGTGTAATTLVPILQIVSVTGQTISSVDYYSGTIKMTGTVTASTIVFKYSNRCKTTGLYVDARWNGTLSSWDVLKGRAKIISKNFTPNVMIVHDNELPGLLYDERLKFLDVSAYGGREAIINAELGKIFGLKVWTTTRTYEGVAIYVDTNNLGYHVIRRPLKGTREDKPDRDSVWYHFWGEENFGVVNDNCVAVSVNHLSKDHTYPPPP